MAVIHCLVAGCTRQLAGLNKLLGAWKKGGKEERKKGKKKGGRKSPKWNPLWPQWWLLPGVAQPPLSGRLQPGQGLGVLSEEGLLFSPFRDHFHHRELPLPRTQPLSGSPSWPCPVTDGCRVSCSGLASCTEPV